ncbi:uncharacterized protein LOC117218059 [Megalopta genalis]|uniref:uncharacterized protein LOC117218059 n=1 Tax=Megalopta genalis TaxID=115081 RepID=UPI003FD05673
MSMQTCGRDQRKMIQVVDQIKLLANNLDDLREEICSLRNNYLPNNGRTSAGTKMGGAQPRVLRKLGKSIKAIAPTNLPGAAWKRPTKEPEICFHHPNSDASLFSSLRYMFRFGKRKKAVEMPAHLKDDSSQTDQTFDKNSSRSLDGSSFSQKQLKRVARFSEISCELDSRVIDPLADTSVIQMQNGAQGKELCLLDDNKLFATVCTQTSSQKPRRRRMNFNFHSKNPNFYFSKIKNAVITRKIVGNPSENALTVCGRIIRENYPNASKKFYEDSPYRTRRSDNNVHAIARENSSYSSINNDESLKNNLSINEYNATDNSSIDGESEATPVASVCLSLEVDVSDSSSKLEEFCPQRKPRTYTIRKPSQNRNENSRHERIVHAGPISDLTLSSHSLSSSKIPATCATIENTLG